MDPLTSFRHGLKQVMPRYNTGIWLHDLPVAWENVLGRGSVPPQALALQAGYQDYSPLLEKCGFIEMIPQPEVPPRTIVRMFDPVPKIEQLARQLRAENCSRYEHVGVNRIVSEICRQLNVPSFDWFAVPVLSVPLLQQLTELEANIYNFISTFLSTR